MRYALASLLFTMSMNAPINVATTFPDSAELQKMASRFAPTSLKVDVMRLNPGDRRALMKLIEASAVINDIFLQQLWSGNAELYRQLQHDTSLLGRARLNMFRINKGPWSDLDAHRAFLPGVPDRKPLGANFYPEDMTREEFEHWVDKLPGREAEQAKSFFTVIRRNPQTRQLETVPYHREYGDNMQRLAKLLREGRRRLRAPRSGIFSRREQQHF